MIIDRLLLLVSRMRVEAPVVHRMISCFLVVSPRFSTLMSYSVDGG